MNQQEVKRLVEKILNDREKVVDVELIYDHWYKISITYITSMENSRELDPQLQDDPKVECETITKVIDKYCTQEGLTEKIELITFKKY